MKNKSETIGRRIAILDLLRGYCLTIIIVDHLMRFPSIFDAITGRGLLWVSAAEAFFFLSGVVTAVVRPRQIANQGHRKTYQSIWKRAGQLYLVSIILTLGYTIIGRILQDNPAVKPGLDATNDWLYVISQTLSFQYVYGWADFLPFYVVYLLLTPLALYLLERKLWKLLAVLAVVGWIIPHTMYGDGMNQHFFVWQAYYFIGIILGWLYPVIMARFQALKPTLQSQIIWTILGLTAVTLTMSWVYTYVAIFFQNHPEALPAGAWYAPLVAAVNLQTQNIYWLFSDNRTGLLRLPMALLWFSGFYLLFKRFQTTLEQYLGWYLTPMGSSSLYVYIVHSAIIYMAAFIVLPNNLIVNSLIVTTVLLLIWLLVRNRILFGIIPR